MGEEIFFLWICGFRSEKQCSVIWSHGNSMASVSSFYQMNQYWIYVKNTTRQCSRTKATTWLKEMCWIIDIKAQSPKAGVYRYYFPSCMFNVSKSLFYVVVLWQESDSLWWDAFATEFFEEDATLTLSFCLEDGPKRYSKSPTITTCINKYISNILVIINLCLSLKLNLAFLSFC